VDPEDVTKCEERYNKAKAVHSVLRHVADQKKLRLETLYQRIGWPLYRKYKHAYDAFKIALAETGEDIFDSEGVEADEETKNMLVSYVKRRLAPQPVKIRADIEVTCFTYEGIEAIRESLTIGEESGTPDVPVRIKLIAPPMYVMTSMTLDKDLGIEGKLNANQKHTLSPLLFTCIFTTTTHTHSCTHTKTYANLQPTVMNGAIEAIGKAIREKGGSLDVKMAPKAVTLREETELQAMLDRLALEQEEVDGDAPEDV